MAIPERDRVYTDNGVDRTIYTRETSSTGWFVGIIVVLAVLAIGYLVWSANNSPTVSPVEVNSNPSISTPMSDPAPVSPAPLVEAPAATPAPAQVEVAPVEPATPAPAPVTPVEPAPAPAQ